MAQVLLVNAGISADLLARVESKTGEELRAPVGTLLPVPAGMKDERKKELRTDLGDSEGADGNRRNNV